MASKDLYSLRRKAAAEGVSLCELGRRGGRKAHQILDWIPLNGTVWVLTRCHDWHVATERERALLLG